MSSPVRFFALLRIKPHTPLLVRAPVNSFEFQPCGHVLPVGTLIDDNCGTEGVVHPTPLSIVYGVDYQIIILLLPITFAPQRQLSSESRLRRNCSSNIYAFHRYTQNSARHSPILKAVSFNQQPRLSPVFHD